MFKSKSDKKKRYSMTIFSADLTLRGGKKMAACFESIFIRISSN